MNYHWNWQVFLEISPNYGQAYWVLFLDGLGITVLLSLVSWLIAMSIGSVVGVMRTVNNKIVQYLAFVYVQVFRGIPLLVQLFLWYFVVPQFIPPLKEWAVTADTVLVQFTMASVCLGLYTSARIAEQVRSGIHSLSIGQSQAAYALGLKNYQVYTYVLMPQTYKIILPPLTSETMNLIKNTSIALTIGLAELTFRAKETGETTFAYFEAFLLATVAYVLIAYSASKVSTVMERRFKRQDLSQSD